MRKRKSKILYSILSILVILGLILSGCGKAAPTVSTPADSNSNSPSTPAPAPAEDPAKVISKAVIDYYSNMGNDIYKIPEAKAKEELEKNPGTYLVLDIRQPDAYSSGHIKGAINIPYGPEIAKNLDKIRALAKGKTTIVACYTGQTAGQTDALLNLAGIKTVSLNYGMGMDGFPKGYMSDPDRKASLVTDSTPIPDAPAVESPNKVIDDAVKNYFENKPKDSYKIGLPEFKEALSVEADKYLVLDIRKAEDFAKGHIKGAINVPFGNDFGKSLEKVREQANGKTVIVYCYTGQTAGQTDALLNVAGIETKSLNFGFGGVSGFDRGWSAEFPNDIEK